MKVRFENRDRQTPANLAILNLVPGYTGMLNLNLVQVRTREENTGYGRVYDSTEFSTLGLSN